MVIEQIKNNTVYKQILADSFGGVMYNVANRNKYDSKRILDLWNGLSESEKDSCGGIMQGVFNFLKSR